MTVSVVNYKYNILQSLYYFLNNETYTKAGSTKTLKSHFNDPQLEIIMGFPPSLKDVTLPTIAIVMSPIAEKSVNAYVNQYDGIIYSFSIYGFCGGEQSFEMNQLQRDYLSNDIKTLFEETDYINIYSVSDPPILSNFSTVLTDVLVQNVQSRDLNPTGPLVADRYRFVVDFEIEYVRSIATENS